MPGHIFFESYPVDVVFRLLFQNLEQSINPWCERAVFFLKFIGDDATQRHICGNDVIGAGMTGSNHVWKRKPFY